MTLSAVSWIVFSISGKFRARLGNCETSAAKRVVCPHRAGAPVPRVELSNNGARLMMSSIVMPGDRTLLDRIKEIQSLPTPPLVFTAINRVISDPRASAYDVASIVSEDPGIAARILRMANSAYYGLPQPVSSIRQAIIILGMDSLRSLVLSVSLMDAFGTSPLEREYQDLIWRHSLATASAARLFFCSRFSVGLIPGCEEGSPAGLLHDIGKMILACHPPAERARVRSDPDYGVMEDRVVEKATRGVPHEPM